MAISKHPGWGAHLQLPPGRLAAGAVCSWLQGATGLKEEHAVFMSAPETSVLQMV